MTAYNRPGVYVQETLNAIPPVTASFSDSIAAFLGISARGPVEPTLISNWSDYVKIYGGWSADNTLALAVFLFFANGGSQCYVTRVLAGSPAASFRTLQDTSATPANTLTVTAKNPGAWGNSIAITTQDTSGVAGAFDLIVYYGGTTSAYKKEVFPNLNMDPLSSRYAIAVVSSDYITLTNEGVGTKPANVTAVALASGVDGDAPTALQIAQGVDSLDVVNNALILNAPGVTGDSAVNELIAYAEARKDVFVVVDPIPNSSVNSELATVDNYTASSYAAVYYPSITINDPTRTTPGSVLTNVSPGGAVVGRYVATDRARGVFKAPAGIAARVAGAVSVQALKNSELDTLNTSEKPVNAIKFVPGSGIVIMGARTLKGGYSDMYVPVRRSLIFLEKALVDLTQFAVFEPNDTILYRRITAAVGGFLTNFWAQGGLRGDTTEQAFFVLCDSSNNPLSSVEAGQVNIQVGVALQRPAEFVVINIGQFDGGATVTTVA